MSLASTFSRLAERFFALPAAGPLATLGLAALLFMKAAGAFPYQFGVDFYQFWGVAVAHRALGPETTPYAAPQRYAQVLDAIADRSPNAKLRAANRSYRESLVPIATPLFNAAFAYVPQDYAEAQLLHTSLLLGAAIGGIFLLARLLGLAMWPAACAALLVALTFNPLWQDAKVGNVNALQLAFLAAMLGLALHRGDPGVRRTQPFLLAALALFVLFKPTTLWIAAALALNDLAVRGRRPWVASLAIAAAAGALGWGAGAWYFRDAGVWSDWFTCPIAMNRGVLSEAFVPGNRSIAMLLATRWPGPGATAYSIALAIALAMAAVFAAHRSGRLREALRSAFADPWFALSAGVVFTFATSPMVWPHYHLLAILPIAWLARLEAPGAGAWGAWVCYALLSTPLIAALAKLELYALLDALTYGCWIFLLPGLLAQLSAGTEPAPRDRSS